jgi:hypothetical protein
MVAGLPGILVRTGKYRQDAIPAGSHAEPIVDSIVDVPGILARILPGLSAPLVLYGPSSGPSAYPPMPAAANASSSVLVEDTSETVPVGGPANSPDLRIPRRD